MKIIPLLTFMLGLLLMSCTHRGPSITGQNDLPQKDWDTQRLKIRAEQHLDRSQWDTLLFGQDVETYAKYSEVFESYPLNKSPFPVAKYDYAVSSIPFSIDMGREYFKGVRIGAYDNPEGEQVTDKLTLLVLTDDPNAEESTLVESRNYPYLTAQGIFSVYDQTFDWVFSASPDGHSVLLVNMKLFDLRFGETVVIYPRKDGSFFYDQIEESPNDYKDFEGYKNRITTLFNERNTNH